VIAALIALAAFLVYHFTVHKIVNQRPLGGQNVNVVPLEQDQSQAAFAIDPSKTKTLFGASNDTGLETLRVYASSDAGKTWKHTDGPAVPGGSCAHGAPSVAADASGRQYLAFLASQYCGDSLTPYLVITSRAAASDRWEPLVRVAPRAWKYGFDDAPSIGVEPGSGRVHAVWTRGLSKHDATVVASTSDDHGRSWTTPKPIVPGLKNTHRARVVVAENGDVYYAGLSAEGIWIVRDGKPAMVNVIANPAAGCAQTAGDPLPKELSACEGPDPSLTVSKDRVVVVYGDVGQNQTPDVYAAAFTRDLKPLGRSSVTPVETKKTQQFMPVSAVDPKTGTLWACWYDTTFDPNAHRVWFTCSASKNGKTWGAPVRASDKPTATDIIYGTLGGAGIYPALSAANGTAHAFWADGRVIADSTDIFTAAIPEKAALTQVG
jgi:hypothetical protein